MSTLRQLSPASKRIAQYLVGFDDIINTFEKALSTAPDTTPNFPPKNIIRHDNDSYELQYAVAGFKKEDIKVSVQRETYLVIEGKSSREAIDSEKLLHHGIALREFRQEMTIPAKSRVDVKLEDGLLYIFITQPEIRIPEPKFLEIQ